MENFIRLYKWKTGQGLWLYVKDNDKHYWYCVVQNNGKNPLCGMSLIDSSREGIEKKVQEYVLIADLADVWKETWKL